MTLPIEIIAASAGSGKTYTLAQTLREALESSEAQPENIVAVTFTIKAAAELEERARQFLVEKGRTEDAHRMAAARIGTVHAVCSNLIRDYAFDLGMAPELAVLDDAAAAHALKAAFSGASTPERRQQLADLNSRMPKWDWEDSRREILSWARDNSIDAEGIRLSGQKSLESFQILLGEPLDDPKALERDVESALRTFLDDSPELDTTKKTQGARSLASKILNRLGHGEALSWDDWARLSNFDSGAKSRPFALAVATAAVSYCRHPQLRADLENAIRLVFDIAADALEAYQDYKRDRGAVDFPDQLNLALQLLRTESVREQLRGAIDLVLVDEFQDTSPIQLAVFIELARLAKRSVWVGDQKQAIYGFLGCDPVLMDSATEAILEGGEPRTLKQSWRSRPGLVELTSDVFAPAFEEVGIPEERTRLTPAEPNEPEGLGPIIERWRLDTGNAADDAAAIAAGVRELLTDPQARVRDPNAPGGARAVSPSDVGVLSRSNAQCVRTAEALADLGVPCVLARPGLLGTAEAELVSQGLARWADPRDTLAAATIARLAVYPADGQDWLDAALGHPHAVAFAESEPVSRIDSSRAAHPAAGVLEAFDTVIDALRARHWAVAHGLNRDDENQRLANLESFRGLALKYESEVASAAGAEGASTTPAGFLAWLRERAAAKADQQAVLQAQGAVVVSTWHGAKGLEWPITVLFDLQESDRDSALGVHIEAPEEFDFDDPLADRWIRFWPNPYSPGFARTFLHERVAEHEVTARIRLSRAREALRLKYVGWTRARDRVVLVSRKAQKLEKLLEMVAGPEGPLMNEPKASADSAAENTSIEKANWSGHAVDVRVRALTPVAPPVSRPEDGHRYFEAGPREHPAAIVAPSSAEGKGEALEPEVIGNRINIQGDPEWRLVGEVFHGFLAADRGDTPPLERLQMAQGLVERWGLADNLRGENLMAASNSLRDWISTRWPNASEHHEWPLLDRLEDGPEVHGSADLVLEFDDRFVLIDHKAFPGATEQARAEAASYGGQLEMYSDALKSATGKVVEAAFIHLPVSGMVVEVRTESRDSK